LYNAVPLFLVGVVLYLALAGENGLFRWLDMRVELASDRTRLADVERRARRLEREVRLLRVDTTTQQRAVAEELLLVPAGSTVFRFAN
jgi:cell division protein FtsB